MRLPHNDKSSRRRAFRSIELQQQANGWWSELRSKRAEWVRTQSLLTQSLGGSAVSSELTKSGLERKWTGRKCKSIDGWIDKLHEWEPESRAHRHHVVPACQTACRHPIHSFTPPRCKSFQSGRFIADCPCSALLTAAKIGLQRKKCGCLPFS